MTTAWKEAARRRLEELGKDHRWLESQIGAGRGMVTRMLGSQQNTSALVDAVCRALAIPGPMVEASGPEEERLLELLRTASPEARKLAEAALLLVARKTTD
jgi:hypothetical protein